MLGTFFSPFFCGFSSQKRREEFWALSRGRSVSPDVQLLDVPDVQMAAILSGAYEAQCSRCFSEAESPAEESLGERV